MAVIDWIKAAIRFVPVDYYGKVGRLYYYLMCKGNKVW